MTKLVNLTPHTINIFNEDRIEVEVLAPSGQVARVATRMNFEGLAGAVPLFSATYGEIQGLPASEADTLFVVSGMVAAATDRSDVASPGELVRDENGKPTGCRGLKVHPGA